MNYNWNWGILLAQEPGGTGTYLAYLIVGLGWTLATALAAWAIALLIGSVVGTLRTTPHKWVVRLGNAYVEIFRRQITRWNDERITRDNPGVPLPDQPITVRNLLCRRC